ncbi:MAG: nitrogen regulation protein NR(II) [Sulfuritalea sp.]|jgi:two-component system nitrogen regulation sensor histidine kinase GlnL|nr:nitrogen regulation protein NR(II) [Sulfuritalea sp.]MDP1984742.1 nitrogen regulation protein NR(II) [Sulfuritalea sp.]
MNPSEPFNAFSGLDLLSSAVVLVDAKLIIRHVNPAAENLFAVSSRQLLGHPLQRLVGDSSELTAALDNALKNNWSYTGHNIQIKPTPDVMLHVDCTVTPVESSNARLLLEVRPIDQQLRAAREEQLAQQQQANRELVRNLAHEIKNPLGGIRGSAQLLERELASEPLKEYTQVIIEEADRLQDLMQRLLSSHRVMQPAQVNIHEILERVRRLIHAEYHDVTVRRDYDTSLPEITGDREQLIQAILNISRNAAQAMKGKGEIIFCTRAARQVTLVKRHHQLALELQVIDNGPGVPENIRDKIFYPLVSGRENGSGLGLTIAQSFVQQHGGTIEVTSRPGRTCFSLMLPLNRKKKED